MREALLVIVNNLLLVGLGVLGELVHEVAHPLDLRFGIVEELLVLRLEGVQVEHELSLFLFKLEVLFAELVELLVELHIAHASLVARGRHAETLATLRIRDLGVGGQGTLGGTAAAHGRFVSLL